METEKAYWAGLLDGEGSIGLYTHNQPPRKPEEHSVYRLGYCWNSYVRIYLGKGKEVLEEIARTYNGRMKARKQNVFGKAEKTTKMIWSVEFDSCKKIKPFLTDITPYLKIKKRQAELLLEYCRLRGGVYTPVENDLEKIVKMSDEIKQLNTGGRKNSHTKSQRRKWVSDNLDACSL